MAKEDWTEEQLWRNFFWVAFSFALNHGAATTPLVVVSSLLHSDVAAVGSGILYTSTCVSALFVATPVVGHAGPKIGLLIGFSLYSVYVGSFALAAGLGDLSPSSCAGLWCAPALLWYLGSFCGGLAAGILWPAQGDFFARTAELTAARSGGAPEEATARFGGAFAALYLLFEVASKLLFSFLQWAGLSTWVIGASFMGLALLPNVIVALRVRSLAPQRDASARHPAIFDAVSLWSDPVIWLLSPTNLLFGFSAAFMNGYVNGHFARAELGRDNVALVSALTAVFAALFSKIFGALGARAGKRLVMGVGAMCFLDIPLCIFVLGCCDGWGWRLLILYVLQGAGRAVYESTNKAMFADFFAGASTAPAFANCMLQSSLAFAASFFLQTALSYGALAAIIVALAVAEIVCLGLIGHAARRREANLLSAIELR